MFNVMSLLYGIGIGVIFVMMIRDISADNIVKNNSDINVISHLVSKY